MESVKSHIIQLKNKYYNEPNIRDLMIKSLEIVQYIYDSHKDKITINAYFDLIHRYETISTSNKIKIDISTVYRYLNKYRNYFLNIDMYLQTNNKMFLISADSCLQTIVYDTTPIIYSEYASKVICDSVDKFISEINVDLTDTEHKRLYNIVLRFLSNIEYTDSFNEDVNKKIYHLLDTIDIIKILISKVAFVDTNQPVGNIRYIYNTNCVCKNHNTETSSYNTQNSNFYRDSFSYFDTPDLTPAINESDQTINEVDLYDMYASLKDDIILLDANIKDLYEYNHEYTNKLDQIEQELKLINNTLDSEIKSEDVVSNNEIDNINKRISSITNRLNSELSTMDKNLTDHKENIIDYNEMLYTKLTDIKRDIAALNIKQEELTKSIYSVNEYNTMLNDHIKYSDKKITDISNQIDHLDRAVELHDTMLSDISEKLKEINIYVTDLTLAESA